MGGEKGHAHSNVKQDNNNATRGSELDIWTYYLKREESRILEIEIKALQV